MAGTTYCFSIYDGDRNGRVMNVHQFCFVVNPIVKVVSSELLDDEMNVLKRLSVTEKEQEMMVANIKEFLFKKTSTPFFVPSKPNWVWSLKPKFSEEDKKHIQRLYLLEEL